MSLKNTKYDGKIKGLIVRSLDPDMSLLPTDLILSISCLAGQGTEPLR